METSSPLAAMHRPAAPFGKRDLFTNLRVRLSPGKPRSGGRGLNGSGNGGAFSIRDQLNQESFGPVHGSSPAGSLAADLCQNFSIGEDASPRFPTPRRALFTSNCQSLKAAPPMPASSSPLPAEALMDMTPVPKKVVAAFVAAETELQMSSMSSPASPCPANAADDQMMLESPCPPQPAAAPAPAPVAASAPGTTSAPGAFEPPRTLASALERRKLPRRASLTRAKGYSFAGPTRMHSDNQLPFFRFGENRVPSASSTTSSSSSLSLSECFQKSPPQPAASQPLADRRPQTSHSPCATAQVHIHANPCSGSGVGGPMRARPSFVSMSSAGSASSSRTGSPINGHIRRQSSSFVRPRRQYRRSLSMFENPIDMMKPKSDEGAGAGAAAPSGLQPSLLTSVMDTDEAATAPQAPILPHFFPEGQNDSIPRIDRATLLRVLDGQFNDAFDEKLIIDCRFEYEYEGGHINEAINYNDKDLLATHLFRASPTDGTPPPLERGSRTLIVLHCEYSAHRAPLMARHIRAEDRTVNAEHYPRLSYPELYILDGGYSGFFGEHPCRCYPQAYVEMDAAEHAFACERGMGRLKQNRKGLHRAQTFAFGQQNASPTAAAASGRGSSAFGARNQKPLPASQFSDIASPTSPGRTTGANASSLLSQDSSPVPAMALGFGSPILGSDRGHARRMASY
ncbi:M-phase inducer tyrosine phosphatase [Sporothrix schenckii 1099-18]|uniref:M-phase inducer phosphatase n=1 Tax=Sporothrix schenckii 1099-18 TaxID=1397361 RepID=A0A0F2M3P6_SPOSC|nr:M-phase inducer tyrosine phosphatase [Sporothrix schenckii 1099-18]KJR83405.1 M-phase inducer tyrosine phosphatase [Sporothrix schenckii 1099-18]